MRVPLLTFGLVLLTQLCGHAERAVLDAGADASNDASSVPTNGPPTKRDAGSGNRQRCGGSGSTPPRAALYNGFFQLERGPLTAQVYVSAVDACSAVDCSSASSEQPTALRYLLTSPAQLPTDDAGSTGFYLVVEFAALPGTVLPVGDTLDLRVESAPDGLLYYMHNQTVLLSRNGRLVFAYVTSNAAAPELGAFGPFGFTFSDGNVLCEDQPSTVCGRSVRALVVSHGDGRVTLEPGVTQMLDGLSLTLGLYDRLVDLRYCDEGPRFILAAFTVP